MAYQHPGLRNNALPTITHLKAAFKSADEPDPAKRDIRPLMAIVAALPKADPDIMTHMQTRRLKVLAWPWHVRAKVPRGQTAAPPIEEQRAAEIEERIIACGIHRDFDALLNALFYGHTGIEIGEWTPAVTGGAAGGANMIGRYEVLDSIDLHPDTASPTGWSRLVYARYEDDKALRVPYSVPEKLVIATYNPMKGAQANYAGGLLRSVIWHTMLKHGAWYDWARFGEKFGDPPTIARYPAGASKADIDIVYDFLTNLAQDSAAAIPDDVKVELLDALKGGSGNVEVFDRFIERVAGKQERILLGQDVVNTDSKTGSLAKAREANTTTSDYNWADIELFQNWLTPQLVRTDYILNYGVPTTGLFPEFVVDTQQAEDAESNARIVTQLRAADYELDDEEVSRKTGFTAKRAAAPTITI